MKPLGTFALLFGLVLGAFMVFRRASGEIIEPAPPLMLVASACALIAWGLFVQLTSRTRQPATTLWAPLLTVLLFAAACSFPGNRLIDWLVWPPAVVAVALSWRRLLPARRNSPAPSRPVPIADQLLQQLTRFRTPEGKEAVRGTLVAEFATGQREATLYVAFCPPFERIPDVDAHVTDDPGATVKLGQRLHNGAQLDVRLTESAEEPYSVTVEFFAAEPDPTDNRRPSLAV